jgi:hypothetical protein
MWQNTAQFFKYFARSIRRRTNLPVFLPVKIFMTTHKRMKRVAKYNTILIPCDSVT